MNKEGFNNISIESYKLEADKLKIAKKPLLDITKPSYNPTPKTKKRYVIDGNWATCTDGLIQSSILVKSQKTVSSNAKSYNVMHPEEAEQDDKDKVKFLAKKAIQIDDPTKREAFMNKKGLTQETKDDIEAFLVEKKNRTEKTPVQKDLEQKKKEHPMQEGLEEKILAAEDKQMLEKKLDENSLGEGFKPTDRSKEQGWKLIATEKDRFTQNFNCAKLIGAAALVGSLIGVVIGSVMGTSIGAAIGTTVGSIFGPVGSFLGGIAGAIVGNIAGYLLGLAGGSTVGAQITTIAMNTFMPCFCYVLTYFSPWSSVHERAFPQTPRALMPDAKVNCLLGGIAGISLPDMEKAIAHAKASMFVYCDKEEDTHMFFNRKTGMWEPTIDFQGDNYDGQTFADFDRYNPKDLGWEQLDANDPIVQQISQDTGIKYSIYEKRDENGNLIASENYFYNNRTGTKTGMYKTPEGDYVLVSRGTHNSEEETSGTFWLKDNGGQVIGASPQYDDDAKIGEAARAAIDEKNEREHTNSKLTVAGHSMGGGKAALAGATGRADEVYAYNPAGVSPLTKLRYGISDSDMSNVFSFSSNYDPLRLGSDNIFLAPKIAGQRIVLDIDPTSYGEERLIGIVENGHDLPYLIEAMKKIPMIKVFAYND